MSPTYRNPHTDTEPQTNTEPETDVVIQTPHARSVANRSSTRFIVRWNEQLLIEVFSAFRKKLQEQGIDSRPAMDAAVKEVIDERCTGDSVVQQLAKRVIKSSAASEASGKATKKSSNTTQAKPPMTPTPSKTAGSKIKTAGSKMKTAAAEPAKASFATPVASPRRNKAISRSLAAIGEDLGSARTPKGVKNEQKTITPITPPRMDDDSGSEYTESPEKAKKKRIRGTGSKAKSGGKKSKTQFLDAESDSEYGVIDTPSKKTTNKRDWPDLVKKNSASTPSLEPSSAHESSPVPVETVPTVGMFEQPESMENEIKNLVAVKELPSPERHLYGGFSRHDSRNNSPPSSNGYIGDFLGDFPSYGVSSGGQPLDNGGFGGLLHSGTRSSYHQDRFRGSSFGISNSRLNQYSNFQMMPNSSIQDFYVPQSLQSFGSHIHGDIDNGNANYNTPSLDSNRQNSFSTNTSGDVSDFQAFLPDPYQSSFFAAASENFDDHDNYNVLETNYSFGGV